MMFYAEATYRCSVHRDKPVGYLVKGPHGSVYRNACTQACADRQIAELEDAHKREVAE